MNLLIPTIKKFLPDWNRRVHTAADADAFCELHDIVSLDTDLIDDSGEYKTRRENPVILIHKFIDWRYRNWVFFHEIGHFILHPTIAAKFSDAVTKRKIERQAHFVAAVALMPKSLVRNKTLAEIADEFNCPRKLILLRKEFYDDFKV